MKKKINDKKGDINIPELMINILFSYLKGLNNEYIKYISNTMMNNFISYKKKMISKKINSIFIIYAKQELLSLREKLLKWEQNTLYNGTSKNNSKIDFDDPHDNYFHLNLNVGPIMNNSSGVPIIINNNANTNDNLNNSNINIKNEYKIKNGNFNRNNKQNSVYSKINNSSSNFSTLQIQKDKKQIQYSSEAPKKNKNQFSMEDKNKKNSKLNKVSSEKFLNKFILKQEKYKKSHSQKKQKIIKDSEEEYKLIYTFEPKVNESLRKLYKKDKNTASNRLYNDSIDRQKKFLEQQYILDNESKINYNKNFNNIKCIELYEDSKTRQDKKEELIKKIEKECGYTYVPKVIHKIDLTNKNNYIIMNDKKNKGKKIDKNKSFCCGERNKDNKFKNLKNSEKNKTSNKLTSHKKQDIKNNKNIDNNNGNKANGLLK